MTPDLMERMVRWIGEQAEKSEKPDDAFAVILEFTGVDSDRVVDGRIVEHGRVIQAKKSDTMTTEQNKLFMTRFVEEVINKKKLDAIDELVAEDFVEHVPFPGQAPGRDGLRDVINRIVSAFPDIHWTLDEQIAEGDTVVSRFTWRGTHRGEFLGIPPTGRSVEFWGVVIDVVRDGRFRESRIIMDTVALLQQLGAMPSTGEAS